MSNGTGSAMVMDVRANIVVETHVPTSVDENSGKFHNARNNTVLIKT